MAKFRIIVCVLALVCAVSCDKDTTPAKLAGTQWGTTVQQYSVLLSFSNDKEGVLSVSHPIDGTEVIPFTYTYSKPHLKLLPEEGTLYEIPSIETKVQGNVIDFSAFAERLFGLQVEIALTKK